MDETVAAGLGSASGSVIAADRRPIRPRREKNVYSALLG